MKMRRPEHETTVAVMGRPAPAMPRGRFQNLRCRGCYFRQPLQAGALAICGASATFPG